MLLSSLVELVSSRIGPSSAIGPVRWIIRKTGGDPDSLDPIFNRVRIEDRRQDLRQDGREDEKPESATAGTEPSGGATSDDVGSGGNVVDDADLSTVGDPADGFSTSMADEASGNMMERVNGIFRTIGEWLSDAL